MVGDLMVELWSAPAEWRQGFIEHAPVLTARAARSPVRGRAARADGDALVIGRHAGTALTEDHLAWTEAGVADEDVQLSRSQLRLTRGPQGWRVAVPGPASSRRSATLRYWGSGFSRTLDAGGRSTTLDAGAHACLAVTTVRACYWALVTTPSESTEQEPEVAVAEGLGTRAGAETDFDPTPSPHRPPGFPARWHWAIGIKFRPYLTWPMDLAPGLVEPRRFIDPATGRGDTSTSFQRAVKKTVLDTQAAAAALGFEPREPNAIDPALMEWLVAKGMLDFDRHRSPWLHPAG